DEPLGLPGIFSSGIALSALVWALIEAGPHGWGSPRVLAGLLVTFVATAIFVSLARVGRAAIVDRPLARNRRFNGSAIASLLWGLGISGVFFFTSLYLQDVLGLRPVAAGATFVPLALALVVSVAAIAPLSARLGSRLMVTVGLALVALGLLWVSLVGEGATSGDLIPGLVVIGAGSGLTIPLTAIALENVEERRMGMASSLLSAIREVSGAFGVAVIGLLVATREDALIAAGRSDRLAFLGGYELGLQVASALTLVGAFVTFTMLREDPS
ncbi:MAG: MFS transporter, partial [Solirubrobacteraceae bacterium]|nr:MFS transporter [Solirubrobacteraceae bacterium]